MKVLCSVLLLGLLSEIARADPPRTPVQTVPHLFGRDVARFVLLAPIVVNRAKPGVVFSATMMVRIVPGTFIPVSEDADGIYYQAVNSFMRIRGNTKVAGGFYVSKTRPGTIWPYVGDAQMKSKSKFGVTKDTLPLPVYALHSLQVGKPEGAKGR